MDSSTASPPLMRHVLVPVANPDDARKTASALSKFSPGRVTVLHVVEKGEGVPDKTPVAQSESVAAESFATFRRVFPDADDHTAYGRDVVSAIFDVAEEIDASAVAYRSRGGNRIVQFLSGDRSLKLVTRADRPVISLPRVEPDE